MGSLGTQVMDTPVPRRARALKAVNCRSEVRYEGGGQGQLHHAGSGVGARCTWIVSLARRNGRSERDKRVFMRSRPCDSRTTIAFEDGEMVAVALKDVSRSGAAVMSGYTVPPGTPVMVGRVSGRVSRAFTGGFALEFDRVLEAAEADRLVSGYQIKAPPLSNAS